MAKGLMNDMSCGLGDNSNVKHLLLRCSVWHESLILQVPYKA